MPRPRQRKAKPTKPKKIEKEVVDEDSVATRKKIENSLVGLHGDVNESLDSIDNVSDHLLDAQSELHALEYYLKQENDLTEEVKLEIEEAQDVVGDGMEKNRDLRKTVKQLHASVKNLDEGIPNVDEDMDEVDDCDEEGLYEKNISF